MESNSIISHISIGTADYTNAKAFYEELLTIIGATIIEDMPHYKWVSFGTQYPEFWVGEPIDGKSATVGNGVHVSFFADSKKTVDAFYKKALALGATDDGAPGPREHYGAAYYGAFMRDLDGHKIEITYWDESIA